MKIKKLTKVSLIITLSIFANLTYTKHHSTFILAAEDNVQSGYYLSDEYSKTIQDYEQLMKSNPQDNITRINLASAYISRGIYFFNKKLELNKAANDLRKAIFYLKYDEYIPDAQAIGDPVLTANNNLTKILIEQKIDTSAKNRFKIAKELRGQGNLKESIVEFNEALADESIPKQEIYSALGDVMGLLQKDKVSIFYYEKALALDSNNPNLHFKLAKSLNKIGEAERAITEYNLALNLNENNKEIISALENIWREKLANDPENPMIHMNLGVILQKKGSLDEAYNQYKIAETLDPGNETIRLNLGTLLQAQGNVQMAMKAYDTILEVNPTHILAHYYRATALKQLGNTNGAISELQAVLAIDPKNSLAKKSLFEIIKQSVNKDESLGMLQNLANNNPNDAITQYNFAVELHSRKKIDEAIQYYQKAASLDPRLIDSYLNIASIYQEKGQYDEAVKILNNALSISPDNKKINDLLSQIKDNSILNFYQQAVNKYNQGNYEGAIQDYLTILAKDKPSSDVYISLGSAYQAANKISEAINSYNKAVELEPDNSDAFYYLGNVYLTEKKYGKALEFYQKALSFDPQNADIKKTIKSCKQDQLDEILDTGLKEFESKRYQKALDLFNNAIKINPDNAYAYYYKGLIYDEWKKYTVAIENYKKAVEKISSLSDAYYTMAVDYDLIKNPLEAKKAYQKFISTTKDKNSEYAKYANQRIRQLAKK